MADAEFTDFESVDYFNDPSIIDDPYPYFDFLQSKGPVWIEPHYGMAVVTGHAEALEVYRNPDLFSACNASTGPFTGLPVESGSDDVNALIESHRDQLPLNEYMAFMDPPRHQQYRLLLSRLFTPRHLKANEEFMWRAADRYLDDFVANGRCEFIHEFSEPFTIMVIADLLGVPEDDREELVKLLSTQPSTGTIDQGEFDPAAALALPHPAFTTYIEDRRREPRDDVLTHLALAKFTDGSTPELMEVVREGSFLFVAGGETTTRLLGSALLYLAENPEYQQTLRDDRELIPNFFEEMLRVSGPVKVHFRMTRRTTRLAGVEIPAGRAVMLAIMAINHDPRRFEQPHEIRPDRANAQDHVSFSRGTHSCLGQNLARAESRISLERILDRMTDIKISDAEHGPVGARHYVYDPTFTFRGLKALHLEFTPS
jgi:cytochrome P450